MNYTHSLQAVCEEIRRLAPKVGLHHDGVVFGSDDFCASIGSYPRFCLSLSLFLQSLSIHLTTCHHSTFLFLLFHLTSYVLEYSLAPLD